MPGQDANKASQSDYFRRAPLWKVALLLRENAHVTEEKKSQMGEFKVRFRLSHATRRGKV
jgi:hypothetical protein